MTTQGHKLNPFAFPGQKPTSSFLPYPSAASFPLALQPAPTWTPTLPEAIAIIQELTRTGELRQLLQQHGGALLLRGLPIFTADDFSEVAHAFGFIAHEEVGRPPVRTVLAGNVKTANEGPPELPIWPHNEYGWSTINPAWVTFCALEVLSLVRCTQTPMPGGFLVIPALTNEPCETLRWRDSHFIGAGAGKGFGRASP